MSPRIQAWLPPCITPEEMVVNSASPNRRVSNRSHSHIQRNNKHKSGTCTQLGILKQGASPSQLRCHHSYNSSTSTCCTGNMWPISTAGLFSILTLSQIKQAFPVGRTNLLQGSDSVYICHRPRRGVDNWW